MIILLTLALSAGCAARAARPEEPNPQQTQDVPPLAQSFSGLRVTESLELLYAEQFGADFLSDGSILITIADSGRFLVVPQGGAAPEDIDADVTVLRQPITDIYLAATSAMCLFDALDALPNITMTGTKAEGWYIPNAKAAMERGEIVYAGRYSAPDYELLVSKGCSLAIESTMIDHAPEVKEKLIDLGIPVLTERSSYEPHPLGRTEWIKLYGLLLGKPKLAEKLFFEQARLLDGIAGETTGKTVAFFYISSAGGAVVRRSGDYVTRMIELAGGVYAFSDVGDPDSAAGSVNLDMERFYLEAKDADVIIYNSAIDGEISRIDELVAKSPLIAEFKAVQGGDVWCTGKDLFQETTGFGLMISDMHRIFTEDLAGVYRLNYLYRLT